ncbi:MAG TPA: cytochrome c [Bryobacteraceae bacterium]|nr:cytochrome c [Bryobacteraceae bacterium]
MSRGKSHIPWRGAIASTAGLLFSILAAAQSKPENVVLPDGPGRDVVVKVCTKCHGAEKFRGHEGTDQHWQAVVDNMISKGATATDAEFDQIVAYLSKNFGYVPEASDLPAGPGKELVERICAPCHGVSLLSGRHATLDAWYRTIDNMVRRGAKGTDDEMEQIAQYLAKNFGPEN